MCSLLFRPDFHVPSSSYPEKQTHFLLLNPLLTTSWAVQLTQVRKPREALGAWGMSLLKAEGTAADEDEDTQANQNDREQHMLPAFENLRDRWTGGHELRQQD